MTTPTSTSVGASTPRWTWATATIATSAAATHFPRWRQRPSGTSPYRIPTIVTASAAICSDGSAHALPVRPEVHPERPRSTQRGCQHVLDDQALQGPSDHHDKQLPHASQDQQGQQQPPQQHRDGPHDPRTATSSIAARRPGARNPASHPTIASSTTVTPTAAATQLTSEHQHRQHHSTTAAVSQPTPVVRSGRGRGGGLPEGRRRRAERGIPPGPRSTACTPGPAGWSGGTPTTPPNRSRIRRGSTLVRRPGFRRVHRRPARRQRQRDPPGRRRPLQQPRR